MYILQWITGPVINLPVLYGLIHPTKGVYTGDDVIEGLKRLQDSNLISNRSRLDLLNKKRHNNESLDSYCSQNHRQ